MENKNKRKKIEKWKKILFHKKILLVVTKKSSKLKPLDLQNAIGGQLKL
jgi:hypothetical protein